MNSTINLILDEASAMHLKEERYFIIGGYLIDDVNYIKSKCQKIELLLKNNNEYIKKLRQIKGNKLKSEELVKYISYIYKNSKSFIPVFILVDKNELTRKNWNENEAFNFFVKCLINYLIKGKIIDKKYNNINIHMDNRTISTNFKNSLETHLNLNFYHYKIKFSIVKKDSKKYPEIRGADIICYILYRIYNHDNSWKTNKIWEFLKKEKVNLTEYQSFFPYNSISNNELINKIKNIDLLPESDTINM